MYCSRVWHSRKERKHLSVLIIQPHSNGKLTKHLFMKNENTLRGEIEEDSKEGRKQYQE